MPTKEEFTDSRIANLEGCVKEVTTAINEIRSVVIRLEERQNTSFELLQKIDRVINGNGHAGVVTSVALLKEGILDTRADLNVETKNRKENFSQLKEEIKTEASKNIILYGGLLAAVIAVFGFVFAIN